MTVTMEDIKIVPGQELRQKNREADMGIEVSGNTYTVSAFYEIGGMDMFRYQSRARGFCLMCRPMKFGNGFVEMSLFDAGLRELKVEAGRFNAKKFDEFVDAHFIWNEAEERIEFSQDLLTLVGMVVDRHEAGVTG